MNSVSQYFKGLFEAIGGLLTGMTVTWKELFTKKITQQYPENRKTLVMSDRFKGELIMPHDENNEHACTSCSICEMNCPNGTIQITSKMIETEDGKKKKILDTYHYNLGMCTFCNLCVLTCPSDAIKFDTVFENAIYTKSKLNMRLNKENSKLREKKKPQPKPVENTSVNKAETEKKEEASEKKVSIVDKPVVENKIEKRATEQLSEKPVIENKENKIERPEIKKEEKTNILQEKPVEEKRISNRASDDKKSDRDGKKRYI